MISRIRIRMKGITKKLAWPFIKLKIDPKLVSISALPLAGMAFYFVLTQQWINAFITAAIASGMDLIDGTVAKETGKTSYYGNYFETMIDKVVEVILFAGFAAYYPLETVLALGFSLVASYAKPRAALVIITDNRDWPSIGEHAEKLLLLLVGILLTVFNVNLIGFPAMQVVLWIIIAMTIVGSVQRMSYARRLIKEAEKNDNILPYLKK